MRLLSRHTANCVLVVMLSFVAPWSGAQSVSPEQTVAALERSREQVIAGLSFSEKMRMKGAMDAIRNNPEFVAANNSVKNAPTLEAQAGARKTLANLKLSLIEKQDPSLKTVVQKIRELQATPSSRE